MKFLFLTLAMAFSTPSFGKFLGDFKTKKAHVSLTQVHETDDVIWGFVFLSKTEILLTRRGGGMELVDLRRGKAVKVSGVPKVARHGQGGLLDVELSPNFKKDQRVYLTYSQKSQGGYATFLGRCELRQTTMKNCRVLLETKSADGGGRHFGSRIVFAGGHLWMTVGDRGNRHEAQKLSNHIGTVLRLTYDGKPAKGNPFVGKKGALPEIYSYGHRNPQGLAVHPKTGAIWEHEHGPRGGDEINLIAAGKNYGWPIITYGREYSGFKVGDGISKKKGLEQPVMHYTPSIAPSGMSFYSGNKIKGWEGNLFIGALVLQHLNRVEIKGNKAISEERLFEGLGERVRAVEMGPDEFLYFSTDSGKIVRISPKAK